MEALLAVAREKSVAGRKSLVNSLADLFEGGENQELSEAEQKTMHSILRRLIGNAEREVREAISERFADTKFLPPDLAYELAADSIEVAFPILMKSDLLKDLDLVEVIRHRTFEHQLAISQRREVSQEVSAELVDTNREPVIVSLVRNIGAQLAPETVERLVEQSKEFTTLHEPLLHRSELGEDLGKKMLAWVSAAMRAHITTRYKIGREEADDLLSSVSADVFKPETEEPSPIGLLVAELSVDGKITAELVSDTIKQGEIRLFEALLKEATGLRPRLVERILFEPGGEGLAIALKSLDYPKETFIQIFLTSRRARQVREKTIKRDLENLEIFYPKITPEAAEKVVARWRRNVNFLAAIREIEI
jgi:uncharacterized protein (DUF2336 family)